MKLEDFHYMYRGKRIAPLAAEDIGILSPIHRKNEGYRRALLLLHGFGSSPAVYRRLIPSLSMYDCLFAPVLPGHGESIAAFSASRADDWLQCALEACQSLIGEYRHVDVMGLSLGGVLAYQLSQQFPLNHLYLLAPAFALKSNVPLLLRAARFMRIMGLTRITNYAGNIHTAGYAELTYRQTPINAIIEILSLIKNFQFAPPTCPVDIFLGRHDEVIDSASVAALFSKLSSVNIHWLQHSAHVLPLDGDLEEIIACINESCQ